ncbi:hypothetical protein AQUCO_00700267v1 [Aquilegia coerulea]|uniref:ATPase AAA-type core domain-containing protein n=1 Tax=Aquilegia coerulea TaxID=218851 RepID=A0A2G5EJ97_AQUCA|nr:hypothetical protein AQUCO_00700267v1 [Aquilegia coerulea]
MTFTLNLSHHFLSLHDVETITKNEIDSKKENFDNLLTIKEQNKVAKLHTVELDSWKQVTLEHPATFDTLALDHKLKREILEDLDRFIKRREFYKRVGTGKSTLVAAMANYLKFDIYDFELSSVNSNDELRKYLLATSNRSILVIEDIDCSINLQNRDKIKRSKTILEIISWGDERIIIFTTNHKDLLDQALLRPGRMDMHIHLSYCTTEGEVSSHSAEVAEELMKSEDADIALKGLLNFMKRKKIETSFTKPHSCF